MNPTLPCTRWHHIMLLAGLVAIGASLRFHRITATGLWLDEYWAVYLATGRGDAIFNMPQRTIIESPPRTTFVDAPRIWHIFTGLDSVIHPPLYYLVLRAWIDLFGDGDFSVRSLSAVFSLATIVLLFDIVRRLQGPWTGLIASAFAAFAPMQTAFSQQARPYTMLVFLGLLVVEAVLFIQRGGSRRYGLCFLAIAITAFALTHYFAAGAIAAVAIYIAITFRGATRRSTILTIVASLLFVGILWGPIFLATRNQVLGLQTLGMFPNRSVVRTILDVPDRLAYGPIGPLIWPTFVLSMIFGTVGNIEWIVYLPLALLVYVSPLFRWRRHTDLLLWWLWAIGSVAVVAMLDLKRHSDLVSSTKYVLLASPAVYAIFAAPLPTQIGRLVPSALLLITIGYGIKQTRSIPQPLEHTLAAATLVSQHIQPGDAMILVGVYETQPAFEYFYFAHYLGEWKNPIILIGDPHPGDLNAVAPSLAKYSSVWMFGPTGLDSAQLPPQWHVKSQFISEGNALWLITP